MGVLKESYKYTARYTPAWIAVALLGFLTVTVAVLLPQIPQLIIDRIINPAMGAEVVYSQSNVFSFLLDGFDNTDYIGMLLALLGAFAVLLAVRYIGHYIRWNISHYYGVNAEKVMRRAVMQKLLEQNQLTLSHYTSGELMSITNSDPSTVKNLWSQNLSILIDQFYVIIIAIYFLSRIDYRLIFFPLALGVVAGITTYFYTRDLKKCYSSIRDASAELNSCVQENINGVRIVRACVAEQSEINKFDSKNLNYKNSFLNHSKITAKYSAIFSTLGQTINIASITLGVIFATQGHMSAGEFLTFTAYVFYISNPIIVFSNFFGIIQNAFVCGQRLFKFINAENSIVNPSNPEKMPEKPNFSMHNVSIKLDENEEIKNVSVEIPYGKKLGIMGKTGAGKSVMIKALTRLFETTCGETCINGVNIKNYNVDDVRQQFSYVMQEVFLFSNTIDANIAYYNPDATRQEVIDAACIAQADSFIQKMPQGYETIVGEKGLGLSGGQKQRVSIARALLKNAPVILLDDCTSALDLETERKILDGIEKNYPDRTLIIASHRASGVINCDEILYLDNGVICERGSHLELMKAKGKYYEIYMAQRASLEEVLS